VKESPLVEQRSKPKLKKMLSYSSLDKRVIHGMVTYEYDKNSNLTKIASFFGDTINPLIYFTYDYENGKKVHENVFNAMGDRYNLSQRYTFVYSDNLLVKEELRYPPDETVSNYTEYKYDKKGNLILEARVQVDPFIYLKTEHQYDSNNLKIKTLNFFDNQEPAGYVDHFYVGNLLSSEKFYGGNNKFYCESNYSYDSSNNLIQITQTREGETKVIESNHYQNSILVEKTNYEWLYVTYHGEPSYSFKSIDIYKYE
jgi:hypothetical protein